MSRTGKSIEAESRLVVSKGWGRKGGHVAAHRHGVSFRDEAVLQDEMVMAV